MNSMDPAAIAARIKVTFPTLSASTPSISTRNADGSPASSNSQFPGVYFVKDLLDRFSTLYPKERIGLAEFVEALYLIPTHVKLKETSRVATEGPGYILVGFTALLRPDKDLPDVRNANGNDKMNEEKSDDFIKISSEEEEEEGILNESSSAPIESIPSRAMQSDRYSLLISQILGAFSNGLFMRNSTMAQEFHRLYYEKFESQAFPCSSGYHRHKNISTWAECNEGAFLVIELDGEGDKFFLRNDSKAQTLLSNLKSNHLVPVSKFNSGESGIPLQKAKFHLEKLIVGLVSVKTTVNSRALEKMFERVYGEKLCMLNFGRNICEVIDRLGSPNVRRKGDAKKINVTMIPVLESSYVIQSDDETVEIAARNIEEKTLAVYETPLPSTFSPVPPTQVLNTPRAPNAHVIASTPNSSGSISPVQQQQQKPTVVSNYSPNLQNISMDSYPFSYISAGQFNFNPVIPRAVQNQILLKPDPHVMLEKLCTTASMLCSTSGSFGLCDYPGCSWVEAHENWRTVATGQPYLDL